MSQLQEPRPNNADPPPFEKGVPPKEKPDTGSGPDLINPKEPDEEGEPVDPLPDMDPDGQDPVEGEVVN